MNWTGKIVGFIIGYGLGNPILAVLGMLAGHLVDTAGSTSGFGGMSAQQRYMVQQAYFRTTFLVMGHIAKADGRVSEDEIRAARTIMQNMNLNDKQQNDAIKLFNEGKQPNFNLDMALQTLYQTCGHNQQMLYRMFIDIQFRAAIAEGHLGPNKKQILQQICQHFGFNYGEFAGFYQQHGGHDYQRAHRAHSGSHSQRRQAPPQKHSKLDQAYGVLGMARNNSDSEIKKAYRVKMSQNHPDKLISKGLPEEMIKMANQKTQEIKEAYDTIMESRGS